MTGLDLLAKTGSRGLLIGGQWRESGTGSRFEVHDPADESVIVDVADGDADDALAALDAAVEAQAGWGGTPPRGGGGNPRPAVAGVTHPGGDLPQLVRPRKGKNPGRGKGG